MVEDVVKANQSKTVMDHAADAYGGADKGQSEAAADARPNRPLNEHFDAIDLRKPNGDE